MQSYYASRASEYDRIYEKPERQADLRAIEQWLPSVMQGETVLEVASGTGYWTQFIAPIASSVLAIDSARETLRVARARVKCSAVSFEVGEGRVTFIIEKRGGAWQILHFHRSAIPA